jgi:hypothetical protein
MEMIIKIIGIYLVSAGVCFLIRPEFLLNISQFAAKGSRVYFFGGVRLFVSVIFLLAARGCSRPLLLGTIGVIFLVSSVFIFAAGADKMRSIIEWCMRRPLCFRVWAVVLFIAGCLIIYAV